VQSFVRESVRPYRLGIPYDFRENSDIDVLVVFDGDSNLFDRYFELKENLEKIFGRSVDIVMEEAIKNPIFRKSINQDRILLYAA
jgi:uncharacterized protein